MATEPIGIWEKEENVFALLETEGRVLTEGEKRIIRGQRRINSLLYEALDALLQSLPEEYASPLLTKARANLQQVPGKEPPGCERDIG